MSCKGCSSEHAAVSREVGISLPVHAVETYVSVGEVFSGSSLEKGAVLEHESAQVGARVAISSPSLALKLLYSYQVLFTSALGRGFPGLLKASLIHLLSMKLGSKQKMKLSVRAIALSATVNYASCFAWPPPEQIVASEHVEAELPENTELARGCAGYNFPHVTCINRYGSIIKGDFERKVLDGSADSYVSTSTPGDSSFGFVSEATFLVFDPVRGRQILGPSPVLDFIFSLPNLTHEGPVYVPDTNELYFARVKPGFLPQLVVNLSAIPPTLSEKLADPPVYAGTGGRYQNREIIYATISGDGSLGGNSFRPGLYALDINSGKSRTLLNNYYGYYFSSLDDMDIDAQGQIWFTNNGKSSHSPNLEPIKLN